MKDKNQTIKTNLYAVTDILALLAIIMLVLYAKKKDETLLMGSAFVGIFAFATVIIQVKFGQTKVSNQSPNTIHAKPEEGAEPVAVPPQGQCYGIDGIKAQGKVYKLPDGVHATVKADGKIKIQSLTAKFIYLLGGGLLPTPPDGGWQKLFER